MTPDTNAGEEMALGEVAQVAGVDIFNTPFVHDARRDVPGVDEVSQPLSRVGVDLVVVSGHGCWGGLLAASSALPREPPEAGIRFRPKLDQAATTSVMAAALVLPSLIAR